MHTKASLPGALLLPRQGSVPYTYTLVLSGTVQAKAYLTGALRASTPLRIGTGPSRPLNHSYQTADWAAVGGRPQQGRRLAPSRLQLYAVTDAACDARQVSYYNLYEYLHHQLI